MPDTINWSILVDVVEGPKIGGSDSLAVGACDKASVTVAAGANLDMQVHPANARDKVQPLALQASAACGRRALTVPSLARATALPADVPTPLEARGWQITLDAVSGRAHGRVEAVSPVGVEVWGSARRCQVYPTQWCKVVAFAIETAGRASAICGLDVSGVSARRMRERCDRRGRVNREERTMVQASYPGVYIVELPSGVHTIAGVSTSVAAFFGRAKKGPMNQAVHCFSYSDFERAFGGPHPQSDVAWSVRMFFGNGGTECYAVRLASGAVKAAVTLKTLDGLNVLTATAKSDGAWGNAIQLEISYNTAAPDETFNLTAIQYDGDTEVTPDLHVADHGSRRAPLRTDLRQSEFRSHRPRPARGGRRCQCQRYPSHRQQLRRLSQSRPFLTTPIATFRTELETMFPAAGPALNLQINVDDTQWVNVDLLTLFGAAAPAVVRGSAWALNDVATRVQSLINTALSASVPGLQVAVAWTTIGNFSVLRITSDTAADKRSVRIRRGASNGISTALMLGLDQGGIEPVRYSNYRPAPTAAYFRDVDQILPLASLTRDEITSIAIDGGAR